MRFVHGRYILGSFVPRHTYPPWCTQLAARRLVVACHPYIASLLDREWLLRDPAAPISWVEDGAASVAFVRDDLTHPLLGGNKFRKLDGLWPQLRGTTDVVTCGGLQSAHTTAVAAVCAEHGIRAHLLVRGEKPEVPTGHHLYTRMLGNVVYVSRAEYADRSKMLSSYASQLEGSGDRRVAIIPEGAAQPEALLGTIRLVKWLAEESELSGRRCHIFVDSGTGATAVGLALGVALLGLPWMVSGIMLAGTPAYYSQQQETLLEGFAQMFRPSDAGVLQKELAAVLKWVQRHSPRKFGKVLPGEVERCREIASHTGVLLDPIWTLATWETALAYAKHGASSVVGQNQQNQEHVGAGDVVTVLLHTGGMLGLCGLAQRFPHEF